MYTHTYIYVYICNVYIYIYIHNEKKTKIRNMIEVGLFSNHKLLFVLQQENMFIEVGLMITLMVNVNNNRSSYCLWFVHILNNHTNDQY